MLFFLTFYLPKNPKKNLQNYFRTTIFNIDNDKECSLSTKSAF